MEGNNINNNFTTQNNSTEENEKKKGRGLFYFVIAFAIIIISIVGATYAYFTATAQTEAENSVQAGSTSVSLGLETDRSGVNNELIPVADRIARYAYAEQTTITYYDGEEGREKKCATYVYDTEGQITEECETYKKLPNSTCVDDSGTEICSVYSFTVINQNSSDQTLTMYLGTDSSGFANLWYAVYTDTPILDEFGEPTGSTRRTRVSDPDRVPDVGEEKEIKPIVIEGNDTQNAYFESLAHPTLNLEEPRKTYTVVLWIHELKDQEDERNVTDSTKTDPYDQTGIDGNKSYNGHIKVMSGNGSGVTGKIDAISTDWTDIPTPPTTPTSTTSEVAP